MVCSDGTADCYEVDSGRYVAVAPADWDGSSALPVLVFFHGHSSSADDYANKAWLRGGASDRGVLLVVPDGVNGSWSNVGSPHHDRDELPYMDEVLADVHARWPVDDSRVAAGGFSHGASMAWDLACYRARDYTAFIPASGAFWEPLPATCGTGAVRMRHTHGTADQTYPMEGRPIGDTSQGDVLESLAILRAEDGCPEDADETTEEGEVSCQVWSSCAEGEVRLCLHDGGHSLPDGFLDESLDWAFGAR